MPKNYNKDVVNAFIEGTKAQSASQEIPQEVGKTIVPTLDITPNNYRKLKFAQVAVRTTTSGAPISVFTASTTKRTFISGVSMYLSKDATCDNALTSVDSRVTVNGQTLSIGIIPIVTLQNQNTAYYLDFSRNPIEIDKGSTVYIGSMAYTVGTCSRGATFYGYEVDI